MKYVISFKQVSTGKFEVEADTLDDAQKRAEAIVKSLSIIQYVKKSGIHLIYRYKREKAAKNGNRKN